MTDQLKTLKDMQCVLNHSISCCKGNKETHYQKASNPKILMGGPYTHDKELRSEAIKWIKELKEHCNPSIADKDTFMLAHYNLAKIQWIEHFFNITEEDLLLELSKRAGEAVFSETGKKIDAYVQEKKENEKGK